MITQKYLKECLHYDPDTGVFVWKVRPVEHFKTPAICKSRNTLRAGKVAGSLRPSKSTSMIYRRLNIKGTVYFAHRLAWLYMYGEWPIDCLDHINGDSDDNRIDNLRCVGHLGNNRNQTRQKNNTSGRVGVVWHAAAGKWCAQIMVNYKNVYLGLFSFKGDAIDARNAAEIEYGFHANHGREK